MNKYVNKQIDGWMICRRLRHMSMNDGFVMLPKEMISTKLSFELMGKNIMSVNL